MRQPTRIVFDFGSKIRVSPPMWLGDHSINCNPGDLSQFTPQGNGVYGYQTPERSNPFKNAPDQDACGGVIYFGNDISKADFETLMRIMQVDSHRPSKDFSVFTAESEEPGKEKYLAQMRVASKFALRFLFGALTEADYRQFPEQDTTTVEALWAFIEHERNRWGTSFSQDKEKGLCGLFGGDGDFAREELAFGFMVENDYHHVYRIWSRAWLVTK